jgi:hypothetical protein
MSMYPIATSGFLTSATSNVIFSNIPQTFTHLQLRIYARNIGTGTNGNQAYVYFNADNTTNYTWNWLYGDGASVGIGYYNQTSVNIGIVPQNGVAANVFGSNICEILDYTNTNKFKATRAIGGYDANPTATTNGFVALTSGQWNSTAAITTITAQSNFNWSVGTRIDLYGISTANATGA